MYDLISNSHKKSNHGDSDIIFNDLTCKYYKPNLKSMIRKFVSQCKDCHSDDKQSTAQMTSDYASIKSDSTGKCHEEFDMEIWEFYKKKFVCVVDHYSMFTQLYELK